MRYWLECSLVCGLLAFQSSPKDDSPSLIYVFIHFNYRSNCRWWNVRSIGNPCLVGHVEPANRYSAQSWLTVELQDLCSRFTPWVRSKSETGWHSNSIQGTDLRYEHTIIYWFRGAWSHSNVSHFRTRLVHPNVSINHLAHKCLTIFISISP